MTSQFGEDQRLWSVLSHIEGGRYIDVGAAHPVNASISYSFYQRGWRGITVEPVTEYADLHGQVRPGDFLFEGAIGPEGATTLHAFPGTGLSTLIEEFARRHAAAGHQLQERAVMALPLSKVIAAAGWVPGDDIHFMTVDVEGSERQVFDSFPLDEWMPWYVVVEATEPLTTIPALGYEPTLERAGYRLNLQEGVNRFYRAPGRPPIAA